MQGRSGSPSDPSSRDSQQKSSKEASEWLDAARREREELKQDNAQTIEETLNPPKDARSWRDPTLDTPEMAQARQRQNARESRDAKMAQSGNSPLEPGNLPSPELQKEHPTFRGIMMGIITVLIFSMVVITMLYKTSALSSIPVLENAAGDLISETADVISPVQSMFSDATQGVLGFFRRLKFLSTLEDEYNRLREENEQLVYKAMLADELQIQLGQYEDISEEIKRNENMLPIACNIIGKEPGTYFSTFTINRGRADGIEEYMAVTSFGALIGYTEQVDDHQSMVRTIIDSEASIAALIQSSRDQGTVRGSLGVDGQPMCRMYYLPDDHLPRPGDTVITSGVSMSFPKGIPIGTVRESTRRMESNKAYIVVEPTADFEHLEYVTVLRYKPEPEPIQNRSDASIELVPLESIRPYPTIRIGSLNYFDRANADDDEAPEVIVVAETTPPPTPSPSPTPQTIVVATEDLTTRAPSYEYQVIQTTDPNWTPTPTPSPSPTPYLTVGPLDMQLEEDE
ncbi:MAG: rod shape-determining protein MreC [Clostridia bacterium]|nr:rod shape-determining protein MreC [Clostridia bacterium]